MHNSLQTGFRATSNADRVKRWQIVSIVSLARMAGRNPLALSANYSGCRPSELSFSAANDFRARLARMLPPLRA
jgi:hypothetical protein